MIDELNRLKNALKDEKDPGAIKAGKAILSGMKNFYLGSNSALAKQRYEDFCKKCEYNIEEKVTSLRVQDTRVPELSNRSCDHCGGCVLSFKLRQSIKPCEKWK